MTDTTLETIIRDVVTLADTFDMTAIDLLEESAMVIGGDGDDPDDDEDYRTDLVTDLLMNHTNDDGNGDDTLVLIFELIEFASDNNDLFNE